ncbi:flagellar hook-associated protein FlgK [Dyella japonica]|uniref:Flagellar hook-associated protein 1 n=1 Tax=Dyella japonica DSM 16301 TaxID=1440762 RepID=A0A0G9GYY3_9GAMM|nr:flagellar hook-associated protein FlgK [Dyella japonica]KLD62114.1 flagellar hook protein FlgK [Dyella japonica DSM 16301]
MSNLLSIGTSGLNAAQVALTTVGNNISNVNTTGYSRQTVLQTEAISQAGGNYTIGSGVNVQAVQRAYSDFLTTALWTSNSSLQRATTYNSLATTLNSSLSASGNLQSALDSFYGAFSTVANTPGVASSRQSLLGSASQAVTVFNTLGQQLAAQQSQVNKQISTTVDSINNVSANIASVNAQIHAAGNNVPNDLLDQRDNLVQTLSGYLGVSAYTQSDGTVSVYTSSGAALVTGDKSFALKTGSNQYDASRTEVLDSTGTVVSSKLSGGSLGALLDYRGNVLDSVQNQLGEAAVALSTSVNTQQSKGLDQYGKQGGPMFSVPSPAVLPSNLNKGTASVSASISDVSQLTGSDYVLSYDGSNWSMATTAGQNVPMTANPDGTYSADGMTLTLSGTAQAGDTFQLQPTRQASTGLALTMTDPNGIAAAAALNATAAKANTGNGAIGSVTVTDPTNAALLSGATVSFPTSGSYQVTDGSGNVLASGSYAPGQTISANGWSVTPSGTPAASDSFSIGINSNGLNDTSNALALAGLADKGVLAGGTQSVIDAYGTLTTNIGTVGSQAASNFTTQTSLFNQAMSAQQSVSGVNLDEEASNMVKYQQAYQASAQVISTAQTIFSSLLTAIQG